MYCTNEEFIHFNILTMTNSKVQELTDSFKVEYFEITEIFDQAHEKLKTYAEENEINCEITIEEGEVYLKDNTSTFFEEEAQTIFDNYVSELLEDLIPTIEKLKEVINAEIEIENSTFDSAAKNYAFENLEEISRLGAGDIGREGEEISFIYKLKDGFLIVIDTPEIDYSYFATEIDEAQKIATEKLYEVLGEETILEKSDYETFEDYQKGFNI